MNVWHATGRLTRDPEQRYTQSGTALVKFGLAVNHRYTVDGEKREKVCFIDCTVWGKSGETFAKHFEKGDAVTLTGRLDLEQWEAQDGTKRSKHSITVEQWEFPQGSSAPKTTKAAQDIPDDF